MRGLRLIASFMLALIFGLEAHGQGLAITGTVRDQKGADMQSTRSSANGAFSFERIAAGTYDLQVRQDGFKVAASRVTVTNRSPRPIDVKLEIAGLQQEITVAADAIQVSTQTDENRD